MSTEMETEMERDGSEGEESDEFGPQRRAWSVTQAFMNIRVPFQKLAVAALVARFESNKMGRKLQGIALESEILGLFGKVFSLAREPDHYNPPTRKQLFKSQFEELAKRLLVTFGDRFDYRYEDVGKAASAYFQSEESWKTVIECLVLEIEEMDSRVEQLRSGNR